MSGMKKNQEYRRLSDVIKQLKEEQSNANLVLDCSMIDVSFFRDDIDEIPKTNYKVILLDIIVEALQRIMVAKLDLCGKNAKYLLQKSAIYGDTFICIPTDNEFPSISQTRFLSETDKEVLKYCKEHRKNVVLVTSKMREAIDARSFGIRTFYLQKHIDDEPITLYGTKKTKQGLSFSIDSSGTGKVIQVLSKGNTYTSGEVDLHIGDHVFIAKKHHDGISFKHLQVIEIQEKFNAENVFSTFIYYENDLSTYPLFYYDFLKKVMESAK